MRRSDVGVLVVRGDGRCIRRLSVPRRMRQALVALGVVATIASATAAVHYARMYHERTTLAATNDMLTRSAGDLPSMRRRLVEVRDEMRAWERLHAEVWKPLGGAARPSTGIGGGISGAAADGKALDEIDTLLAQVREESQRLRALAHATRATGPILAALPSKLPLPGALNSPFGPRVSPWTGETEFHAGIDFAAPPGTPVKASSAGVVRFAGTTAMFGGNVLLDHGAGVQSRYAHLQKTSVTPGQRVERGQTIGLTGNTGRSTGPHLHYEVLVNGRAVDPRRLVRN